MNVIIDGDIIANQCAYGDVDGDVLGLRSRVVKMVLDWAACADDEANIVVALSSGVYFRYWMYREYKAARKLSKRPAPPLLKDAFDILKEEFEIRAVKGLEGDDILGIMGTDPKAEAIMVTIDKDLLQVPGLHYNPSHPERGVIDISPADADLIFHLQWLTGDTTDGVPGIPGIGPKKAAKILVGATAAAGAATPDVLRAAVIQAYDFHGLTPLYCHQMETCIRVLRWADVPDHMQPAFRL